MRMNASRPKFVEPIMRATNIRIVLLRATSHAFDYKFNKIYLIIK